MTRIEGAKRLHVMSLMLLPLLLLAGCADSNNGDVLDPQKSGLTGTWDYLVTNGYQARFVNCTGDATVLEGETLVNGMALAPICMTGVTFQVDQSGDAFEAPPYQVTCSDGAGASVSGVGQVNVLDIGGQWDSVSDQGVTSAQMFTGYIVGNTIELSESRRVFTGAFEGACDFSPALTVTVTVQ